MEDYFLGVHQKEVERLDRQHTAWQPETQQLIQQANLPNCKSILDLGCGPGFTTFEIAKHCPTAQITALDKATLYQKYLQHQICLLYTSPSPRDATLSRMPSSA